MTDKESLLLLEKHISSEVSVIAVSKTFSLRGKNRKIKMGGLSSIFKDVAIKDNPNWYMVSFNVTAFVISTLFISIIICYLNSKVGR